jgi:hypothetical protein
MKVHFWGSTRKFFGKRFEICQGPQQHKVRRIIASQIAMKSDLTEAARQLCDLRCMVDAISDHGGHRDHFRRHLQRYARTYLPPTLLSLVF